MEIAYPVLDQIDICKICAGRVSRKSSRGNSPEELMQHTDIALYKSKQQE